MPVGGGSGGGASDIQAGGAFVRIYSKDDLSKTLDKLRTKFNSFGKFINSIGNQAALGGAAILAPLTALFTGGVNRAANVGKLAEQFGVGAEQMSRFAFAAEDAGVSLDEVISNQERFAAIMARAPIFDSQTAKDALETQRGMKDAIVSLQGAMLPLVQVAAPLVRMFAEFAMVNKHVPLVLAAIGVGFLVVATAAKAAAAGIVLMNVALAIGKTLLIFYSPQGVLALGLLALGAYLLRDTEAARGFGQAFHAIGETGKEAWGGIVAAMKRGDMELAAKIAFKGVELAWLQMLKAMKSAWFDFKDSTFGKMRDNVTDGLAKSMLGIGGMWNDFLDFTKRKTGEGSFDQFKLPDDRSGQVDKMRAEADAQRNRDRRAAQDAVAEAAMQLRKLTEEARGSTLQNESSLNARLNAANVKGAFQGPLAQQLGIGDTFQKKLLATNEKAVEHLAAIRAGLTAVTGLRFQ